MENQEKLTLNQEILNKGIRIFEKHMKKYVEECFENCHGEGWSRVGDGNENNIKIQTRSGRISEN